MLQQPRSRCLAPFIAALSVIVTPTARGDAVAEAVETAPAVDAIENETGDSAPRPAEAIEVETADGFLIVGKYFAPFPASDDSAVVVMVADEGESHMAFDRLAESLRWAETERPIAVLTASLRGQGDSTRRRARDGSIDTLRRRRPTAAGVGAMIDEDMEAIRSFLVDKNDARELNLNRLVYLGVGMGAVVAANATAVDYAVRDLPVGKQGRDVKTLVLVSPLWQVAGVGLLDALRAPGLSDQVATLVLYGDENRRVKQDSERIVRQLNRERIDQPQAEEGVPQVVGAPGRTPLQGSAFLKQGGDRVADAVARFIDAHVCQPDHPWVKRRVE